MKPEPALPIFKLFAEDSTVDFSDLADYLRSCPGYSHNSKINGRGAEHQHLLSHTDRLESAIRYFLSGAVNNLSDVRAEYGQLHACFPEASQRMTAFAIDSVLSFLIDGQYFELIDRLKIASTHLKRRFGIVSVGDLERFLTT